MDALVYHTVFRFFKTENIFVLLIDFLTSFLIFYMLVLDETSMLRNLIFYFETFNNELCFIHFYTVYFSLFPIALQEFLLKVCFSALIWVTFQIRNGNN